MSLFGVRSLQQRYGSGCYTNMKPAVRAHYVNTHNLHMRRLEQQAHKLTRKVYRKQKPHVVNFIRSGSSIKSLQKELKYFYKESIRPIWASTLKQVWQNASEEADSTIKEWIAPDAVKKAWADSAKDWMDQWGAGRIDSITGSDLSRMNTILSDGAEQGLSPKEIAGNLGDNFEDMTSGRAMTIAQTETNGAYNYASVQAATEVAGNWTKEWIVTSGNPRPAHADADGQEVPIDEPFDVDGEDMMYPGDPSGSVENVVNCMCTVGYNSPLESGGTEGAEAEPEGE